MDRREFLRKSALMGGAAYLGSKIPAALAGPSSPVLGGSQVPGESILGFAASECPIDTIVVLMMENRSTDHYLGWLATDEAFLAGGMGRYGPSFHFEADNTQTYLDQDGAAFETYQLTGPDSPVEDPYRGCGHPDPGHSWNAGRAERELGFLGAGSGNDEFALGYYVGDDLPTYDRLARQFTTFDHYHCSLLGPTFPNREYMHSAQSGGHATNYLPIAEQGFDWITIWDKLQAAGMTPSVDAGYFFVDLPAIALWGARMIPFAHHIEEYFARAASGTLPKVTFIDPGFTTGMRTDDHPFADIRAGQSLVHDIVSAFTASPQWKRGALFINYDEWGGFFDHVAPPTLPDDRAGQLPIEAGTWQLPGFEQAGFRTPTLLVSPFALPGFVDHRLYDHTSILRFIEWRFLGAPGEGPGSGTDTWFLTARDRHANNIGASLRTTVQTPEVELSLPQVPVASAPCEGEALEGIPGVDGIPLSAAAEASGHHHEKHAFEQALHAGYFEAVGFTPDLRPLPTP